MTTAPTSIDIVLIENQTILRDGLRALLELEADLRVVGEAGNARDGVAVVQTAKPTLVITDLFMPGDSESHTLEKLRTINPCFKVLVLTAYADEIYIKAALRAGAEGYVLKQAGRTELVCAIRTIVGGREYYSASVSAKLLAGYLGHNGSDDGGDLRISRREREVLTGIALGASNKRLANKLCLSVKTVEKYRANLMRKFGLHNTAAVTLFAVRNGLVPVPGSVRYPDPRSFSWAATVSQLTSPESTGRPA